MNAARDQFTRGLEAFQALSIRWGVGNALTGLAAVAVATGDAAQAERLIEEALLALIQREVARKLIAMGGTMPDFAPAPRERPFA